MSGQSKYIRRGLALGLLVVLGVGGWILVRALRRGYWSTHGSHITRFTLKSKLLGRSLQEVLVTPPHAAPGRPLLVFLHGRSSPVDSVLRDWFLRDSFFKALASLGDRAPVVLLANGGDHSYWHNRSDGPWGTYVLREVIPAALARTNANPKRVAIGGISMGGFGALDLARLAPHRFCAVGGHSAALWFRSGDSAPGAFDDSADFARHDLIAAAATRSPYRIPVWIDVGRDDPFRAADTRLARELRADGARVTFHVWPGNHGGGYWRHHYRDYLRFYAAACGP